MEPNSERTPPEQPRPPEPPGPRKRFRIQRLEERIAPKKGRDKNTHACPDTFVQCTWVCSYPQP